MKITVTQEHIDAGAPCNGVKCPIFLACVEQGLNVNFVNSCSTTVGAYVEVLREDDVKQCIFLSPEVSDWIDRFDGQEKDQAQPFEFELEMLT